VSARLVLLLCLKAGRSPRMRTLLLLLPKSALQTAANCFSRNGTPLVSTGHHSTGTTIHWPPTTGQSSSAWIEAPNSWPKPARHLQRGARTTRTHRSDCHDPERVRRKQWRPNSARPADPNWLHLFGPGSGRPRMGSRGAAGQLRGNVGTVNSERQTVCCKFKAKFQVQHLGVCPKFCRFGRGANASRRLESSLPTCCRRTVPIGTGCWLLARFSWAQNVHTSPEGEEQREERKEEKREKVHEGGRSKKLASKTVPLGPPFAFS